MHRLVIAAFLLQAMLAAAQNYCTAPSPLTAGYAVDTANGNCTGNMTAANCKIKCASGYTFSNGVSAVTVNCATANGTFDFTGCTLNTCNLPATMTAGYVVDNGGCVNGSTAPNCKIACASGYTNTSLTVTVACATQNGPFDFSGCTANKCIPPTNMTGYAINTAGCGSASNAVTVANCSMKCAVGWYGASGVTTTCSTDLGTFVYSGCVATAVCNSSAFCGSGKTLKANSSQITCNSTVCSVSECCDTLYCGSPTAAAVTCGAAKTLKPNPMTVPAGGCSGTSCTVTECCDTLYCGSATVTCGAGKIAKSSPATTPAGGCAGTACTVTECCDTLPNCTSSFTCSAASNLTLKANPATITCSTMTCGAADCCTTMPLCTSFSCPTGFTAVTTYATKRCATYACTAADCCNGAIMNSVSFLATLAALALFWLFQ